jgi:sugar phosphate isomerase/epimerase
MRLGIFAKTFERPAVEGVFEAVKAHGLDCVQFNMSCAGLSSMPDAIDPTTLDRIRAAAQASGVEIAAVSGTYNMIHPDAQVREQGLRRLGTLAAASVGLCVRDGLCSRVITLCTGTRDPQNMWRRHPDNDSPGAWADLLRAMERALHIAEEKQVTLAIEPEHANVVSSAKRCRALLDELRSPRLKVVIDGANLIEPGSDQKQVLDEAFDLLAEDMVIAHAKDRSADGGFCAAGQGNLDYRHYLSLLQASAFAGPLILHGLGEGEVVASLEFLNSILQEHLGG